MGENGSLEALADGALELRRAGDILWLALGPGRDDVAFLRRAATGLRNLLAHAAVLEVADRLLQIQPDDWGALELRALSQLRLHPGQVQAAVPLLLRATELAPTGSDSESRAILGRLHKQAWRSSWMEEGEQVEADRVDENRSRARARIQHLFAAVDAYWGAYEENPRDPYPAVNAMTLTALAELLTTDEQPRWRRELTHEHAQRCEVVAAVVEAQSDGVHGDAEARYWALVTRAELRIVGRADVPDPDRARQACVLLRAALRLVGPRSFLLDSTMQQLRMMLALGFRPQATSPALGVLLHAWSTTVRPDQPATRIVFAAGAALPAPADELSRTASALAERSGDAVVYLGASPADLAFGEACASAGLAYQIHLPEHEGAFVERALKPLGADAMERWGLFRSRAIPPGPLVMPQRVGAVADRPGALERWMLCSARAYGGHHVVLVGPAVAGEHVHALRADVIKNHGSFVEVQEPLAPAGVPDTLPPGPPLESSPLWLEDLGDLLASDENEAIRRRWDRYRSDSRVWALLGQLEMRFEPVEQLPRAALPAILGFEVLAMRREREGVYASYGGLRAAAEKVGIEPADLDVAILAFGLQTIQQLREQMQRRLGARTALLYFTLNLNHGMIRSGVIRTLLDRYFNPVAAHRILLELSEEFPEDLKGLGLGSPKRHQIIDTAVADLTFLVHTFKINLVLDDSDQLDPAVRAQLRPLAVKTKADMKYVDAVFARAGKAPPEAIVEELATYRMEGKPYVLEGIGESARVLYLDTHWPERYRDTAMQGWAIRLPAPLDRFFTPMREGETPQGYRLDANVLRRLGLR